MDTGRSLVVADHLITAAEQGGTVRAIDHGAVLVDDGAVASVGDAAALRAAHPDVPVIGGPGLVAMPGMVNGHHHVGLTPTQLGAPSDSLELWTHLLGTTRPVDPYLDTLVSGLEMIHAGVTTVQHLTGAHDRPEDFASDEAKLRAYADLGIRVSYSVGVIDQNRVFHGGGEARTIAGLPEPYRGELTEWLSSRMGPHEQLEHGYSMLRERWEGAASGRIRIQLAPTNLHWCSDDTLHLVADLSARDGVPMHMHLLETPYQRVYGRSRSPRGAVGHLAELGILSPRLTIGHGVHVDERDLDLLAEHGVSLCHNPSSNLRLKSGIAPLQSYLDRGIPVAIGIDEAGLADDRDMLLELKLAYNLHRRPGIDSPAVSAGGVLAMATANGAHTTPFGDAIGRLEVGARADIVLIDRKLMAGAYLDARVPVEEAIVHRARPDHVRTVIVDGRVVMDDGVVGTVSEADVLDEIAARLSHPWPGEAGAIRRSAVLIDAARRHYAEWLE